MAVNSHFDQATIVALRRALDEVLADRHFAGSNSISAAEIAEHILVEAAQGNLSVERLKASALRMIKNRHERSAA